MLVLISLHNSVLGDDKQVAGDLGFGRARVATCVSVERLILRVSQLVDHLLASCSLMMLWLLLLICSRGVVIAEKLKVALGYSGCGGRAAPLSRLGGLGASTVLSEEVGVLFDEDGVITAFLLQVDVAVLSRCCCRFR